VETAFTLTLQLEYPNCDATGTNTMAETVAIDRPSVAKPVSRPRSRKPATVSASALALHLDCSRAYIGKLEAEGVIQREGGGFPLDQSRVAYLRHLRRGRQQSPRAEADADHVRVKTEMLQMRLMEKRHELVRRDDVDALIDQIAGTVLTHLSGMSARCSRDMQARRNIDAVVMQIRREIAEACLAKADEWNEPALDKQA
jgi:hypothetical protein